MSVNDNKGVGDSDLNPGGNETPNQNQDSKPNDSVSHDTYKRAIDEIKAKNARLQAYEENERKQREKSGEFEKLYQEQVEENRKLKDETKKERANFAYSSVASQFEAEAAKLGCKRIDALTKLVDLGELASSVGDGYKVDPKALKAFAEKAAKDHDYLFAKDAPTFRDAAPGAGKPAKPVGFEDELKNAKTQKEFDAVLKKYGKI